MVKIADFKNLSEENSSEIPVYWTYLSISNVFKLLLVNQIVLKNLTLLSWNKSLLVTAVEFLL